MQEESPEEALVETGRDALVATTTHPLPNQGPISPTESPSSEKIVQKQEEPSVKSTEATTTSLRTQETPSNAHRNEPPISPPLASNPMSKVPPVLSLLKSPCMLIAPFRCGARSALLSTFDTVLSLHVKVLFGWTFIGAGLIFLTLLIPSFGSPAIGWLNDEIGPKLTTCGVFAAYCPTLVLLRLSDHDSIRQITLMCVSLLIIGFGVHAIAIPLSAEISYAIDTKEEETPGICGPQGAYTQGYALLNMGFSATTLVGQLWSGHIVVNSANWGNLGRSLGLPCVLTTVPIVTWTGT